MTNLKALGHRYAVFKSLLLILLLLASGNGIAADGDLRDELRSFLEGLDAGNAPLIAGSPLNQPDLVGKVYRQRQHAPLWTTQGSLRGSVDDLPAAISESTGHRFSAERYRRTTIEKLINARDGASQSALDALLADAFSRSGAAPGVQRRVPPRITMPNGSSRLTKSILSRY